MAIPPPLLQFGGSLVAILVLAAMAWKLRLGPARMLHDEAEVRAFADEVEHGFEPVAVAPDRAGNGALLCDAEGRVMVLRRHGTHVAGRVLGPAASARRDGDTIEIDTGERRFGKVVLEIDDAAAWARRIDAIRAERDA